MHQAYNARNYNGSDMTNPTTVDQIAERVEHLLLRHEELQKTNALLQQQVLAISHERDLLKSKLAAARSRVDALIERLPQNTSSDTDA
ncbi:hypothetical protein L103DPR2_02092 [Limnohabitans sp. 103DPR2]|nr:hypothetical protein L103DPR2_02092 [Limnohabitans sp. 103DPR2]